MANRYGNLVGSKRISEDFETINVGFDRVQAEMDTKGTPADAQTKADAAKAAAIATAAEALAAHKARGADEHPNATGAAAGFMSSSDKGRMNAATADPTASTLMQRDAAGRAKVTAPAAADDIARKAETDAVQSNLNSHATDTDIHVTAADHTKLNGIAAGAEVNQNAFAVINDVEASSKSDTVVFVGGTGITVTTDPEGKRIVLTATGEATPGAHASSHITGGTDVIPDAVVSGSSGLMSGSDAKFVRQDGESKTGAQAKADAAEQAANEYTDQKVGEIVIDDASLTQKGITQLSSATESDEEGEAATPKAVNTVRQLAVSQIGDLSELQTTDKDNLVDALNEVFQSGSEFKGDVADAITAKGVPTSASDSKETFVQNIESIETSTVINGQQQLARTYAETIAANDPVYAYTTFLNDNSIVNPPPTSVVNAVDFTPDGTYLTIGISTSPFFLMFKKSGKVFTRLSNPSALPTGTVYGLSWTPDGVYLAVAHAGSPNLTWYKRSGDTLSKLSNPSTLPPDTGLSAAWSPDGIYLAVGHIAAPCLTFYKRTGDTLVKQADPAVLPSSTVNSVDWSPDGVHLAIGSNSASPYAAIYKRTGDSIARLSTPNFLPSSTVYSVAFSPDGVFLAIGWVNAPYVYFFKRSGDIFTRVDGPPVYTSGPANSMSWDDNNEYLYIAHNTSPFFSKYRRWGDKFRKMPDLNLLPASGKSVAFNNGMLAVGSNALEIYSVNYDQVFKSTNEALTLDGGYMTAIGYALESGQAGDTKNIMSIWR